jgi:hypothetical protein
MKYLVLSFDLSASGVYSTLQLVLAWGFWLVICDCLLVLNHYYLFITFINVNANKLAQKWLELKLWFQSKILRFLDYLFWTLINKILIKCYNKSKDKSLAGYDGLWSAATGRHKVQILINFLLHYFISKHYHLPVYTVT